jgi:hypothetical protein
MATKKSTGRRASQAKTDTEAAVRARYAHLPAAAPALAINIPAPPPAPALLPNYYDLLNGLINVKGSLRLAHTAVYTNSGAHEALADAEGVLTLAVRELERVYALIDSAAVRDLWETQPSSEGSDDE